MPTEESFQSAPASFPELPTYEEALNYPKYVHSPEMEGEQGPAGSQANLAAEENSFEEIDISDPPNPISDDEEIDENALNMSEIRAERRTSYSNTVENGENDSTSTPTSVISTS